MHSISAAGLGWSLPDGSPLFGNLDFHLSRERIGLVGANGSGKSTLLRILSGQTPPARGSVSVRGTLAMVPQDVEGFRTGGIAEALGVGGLWRAWSRVRDGMAEPEDADLLQGDWDLEERCHAALQRCGLGHLDPDRPCLGLSGGELLRVAIAGALWRKPDFLILDEPTNHLDEAARADLRELVRGWQGGLLIASHDRGLLRGMDRIAELSATGLRLYGGGYEFYRNAREGEDAAAAAAVEAGESRLRKDRLERRRTLERQSKRSARGAKQAADLGLPKIVLGMMKRGAEESSARLGKVHAERVERSLESLARARDRAREDARILMDPAEGAVPERKILLRAEAVNLRLSDGTWLWRRPVDLEIRGPERVALSGRNGSGKSLLLAMLQGRLPPTRGSVWVGARRIGLLDQAVAFLDGARSVLENLRAHAAPDLSDAELRIRLGRFHFPGKEALKPAGVLSGGERMRAGLACLLASGRDMDLLMLDEPGNNLDFAALAALESALDAYRGALIVVSHDADFLRRIGPERVVSLDGWFR